MPKNGRFLAQGPSLKMPWSVQTGVAFLAEMTKIWQGDFNVPLLLRLG